jgi:hypothetical protein
MSHIGKYIDDDGLLYLWGKTKSLVSNALSNSGFYTKPSGGIPSNDLSSTVQSALNSGSSAYQKPSGGIPKTDLASAVQTSLGKADTALQSESDPVFTASAAHGITSTDISNWNAAEANVVKSVNTTAGTSGVNLSLSSAGALDVTITSGSVASGNTNFVTGDAVNTAIQNSISSITGISFEIVTNLPSTGSAGVIYLISNSGSGQNVYDEYIWVNNAFEKIGTANVDLSGYLQKTDYMSNSDMDTATNNWA